MARHHKWANRLTHYLMRLRSDMDIGNRSFSYRAEEQGAINCAIFAAEVAKVLDPTLEFPQALTGYTDSLSAAAKITREEGVKDIHGLLAKYFTEKPVAFAHRGDLVLIPASDSADGLFPVGICMAEPPHYWGVTELGLGYGPLGVAVACFSVTGDTSTPKVKRHKPLWTPVEQLPTEQYQIEQPSASTSVNTDIS